MKTITMYELLGIVKDGKAPKKIKYENNIYVLNDNKAWADEVYSRAGDGNVRLNFKHIKSLNDEIEILKEEKKIPEKLKIEQDTSNNYYVKNENGAKCYLTTHSKMIAETLNQVIDYLKSKGDE